MAEKTMTIHGITVDKRDKSYLIEFIEGMVEDYANQYKRAKTNAKKRSEKNSLSFFASVLDELKGGAHAV